MHCSARSTGSAKIIHHVNFKKHYFLHWHCPTKMDKCPTLFVLGREIVLHASKIIIYIYIYIKLLLTEREVCTEKHRTEVFFFTDRARKARSVQKDRGPIFLCTYRASEVNKKFIIWHLYKLEEMHDWKCMIGNAY
jgi:hypothetical protein